MAWVPIEASGIAFTFNGGFLPVVTTMTDSVASLDGLEAPYGGEWSITLESEQRVRITTQQYSSSYDPSQQYSYFYWTGGQQLNTAAAGFPGPGDVTAFTPTPFEITDVINFNYGFEGSGHSNNIETYSFLVEVWVDDPVVISYNCECDDEYPTKTLAQMREYLMIRLGWGAMVSTPLPGVAVTLNSFLRDAQEQIYRQYKVFRLERFFTWPLLTGVRFYDLPANEDVCTKKLDPRMITWVGISEGDNFWRKLVCGIKPEFYYGDISSWPTHYEIRQCIEVWPPPSSDDWKLRIKGYFGLLPLDVDTDVNTIDYEAIQLFALANAKAHYGQPDAANYMGQYRDYIGAVTAGSHHTRRYVPNTEQSYPPPLPILTGWPGDP